MCFESPKLFERERLPSLAGNGSPTWLRRARLGVRVRDSDLLCQNKPIVLLLNRQTEELREWEDK